MGYSLRAMSIEDELRSALRDLDAAAVSARTASEKPDLVGLLRRIDVLTAQLPAGTDPMLRHYLERKSYAKARAHLGG